MDYCLVRRNRREFSKSIKFLPNYECITQHKSLLCDFKTRKVKYTRIKFAQEKDMETTKRQCKEWFQVIRTSTGTGQVVKKMLLLNIIETFWKEFCQKLQAEVMDGPKVHHKKTWWWNDDISNSVHSISHPFYWG